MERRYISAKEVAEYLGLKIDTLRDWVYRRKIPYHKLGRLVRFDLQEIEGWMEEKKVGEMR